MSIVLFMIVVPLVYGALIWAEVLSLPILNVTLQDGSSNSIIPYIGTALSLLGIVMAALIPGSYRTLRLEQSHRNFDVGIDDVATAYYRAHRADRSGAFRLIGEFDSIKERFELLKTQFDLQYLEPELLTLAAEMSYEARALAATYNNEAVARAQDFLRQRKYELAQGEKKIAALKEILQTVSHEAAALARVEQVQDSHLARITEAIGEKLASLGFQVVPQESTGVVLDFPSSIN